MGPDAVILHTREIAQPRFMLWRRSKEKVEITAGTGVNAVDVWAYPLAGGDPIFIGAASLGAFRPDVGAAFGSGRYSSSGFDLHAFIPAGDYNLVVFARSSVIGSFNNATLVRIRVL